MVPDNVSIDYDDIKFRISWIGPPGSRAYMILAARDSEFISERRCFYVPVCANNVSLDMGGGEWFFRVGCFIGNDRGTIRWSNIYGPYMNPVAGSKLPPPPSRTPFSILYTRPIQNGLRVHVDYPGDYIMIIESSRLSSDLAVSQTDWSYQFDSVRRGFIDALNFTYPHRYNIRCSLLEGIAFPTDRIVCMGVGKRYQGVAEKPLRHTDLESQGQHRGDTAILRQTENSANVRFSSHADYLRYQAAKARVGGR